MIKKYKKSIGIDVSDYSIELVELEKQEAGLRVSASNRIILEPGIIERGEICDIKKLQKIVKNLFVKARPKSINGRKLIFSLPDNQVYTSVFRAKISESKGIKQAIESEIKNNIPLIESEISYAYKVIKEDDKKSKSRGLPVVLIAVKKSFLAEWNDFFASIGVAVDYFETESLSLFRGMYGEHPSRPIGILDIGASRSHFSIFGKNGIEYAFSSSLAGNLITANIAKEYNRNFLEAERIKIEGKIDGRGMDMTAQLGALKPLFDEVEKTVNYFNAHYAEEGALNSRSLERVALSGGSSNVKGIINYINQEKYSYRVEIGEGIIKNESVDRNYVQAIGSAIRGLDDKWEDTDPFLSMHHHGAGKISGNLGGEVKDFFVNRIKPAGKKILIWLAVVSFIFLLIFIIPVVKNLNSDKTDSIRYHTKSFKTYLDILNGVKQSEQKIFKARIISISSEKPAPAAVLLAEQKSTAQGKLLKGELLSPEPINMASLSGTLVFPITLEWLAYDEAEFRDHCLKQGKMKFANNDLTISRAYISNLIHNSAAKSLSGTGYCEVVSSSDLVESEEIIKEEPLIKKQMEYVKIDQIGSTLNVRSGPGTSYAVVAGATPGTEYEMFEERNGWIKIRIDRVDEAWVSANFVKKIVK